MTDNFRAIPSATRARHAARPSSYRFGLRTLFLVTTVCASLAALCSYFGNATIPLLLLGAAALWAVTVVIDASLATRDFVRGFRRRRSTYGDQDGDNQHVANSTIDRRIDDLRIQEQIAAARYDARTGAFEDVLRARAVRLQAEIAALRANADRRVSHYRNQVTQNQREVH